MPNKEHLGDVLPPSESWQMSKRPAKHILWMHDSSSHVCHQVAYWVILVARAECRCWSWGLPFASRTCLTWCLRIHMVCAGSVESDSTLVTMVKMGRSPELHIYIQSGHINNMNTSTHFSNQSQSRMCIMVTNRHPLLNLFTE